MAMSAPTPSAVAFSRFGLGPDPTGGSPPAGDPRAQVEAQIGVSPSVGLDPHLQSVSESMKNWRAERNAAQERKRRAVAASRMADGTSGMDAGMEPAMSPQAPAKKPVPQPAMTPVAGGPARAPLWYRPSYELGSRVQRLLKVREGLPERLVLYWTDHFSVGVDKGSVMPLAGAFERVALRPNIYAPFRELLFQAVTHPAMLRYLDNDQSFGPNSPAGNGGKRGLNENLAREVLELHTLGVNGGYTQQDVQALAAVLSGWVIVSALDADNYGDTFFQEKRHEPGPKTILGKTYPDRGEGQLRLVLDDLARHPATARHVATRMCRSFVSEDPPPALVARMAETFQRTDGNLAEVTRTLVVSEESWTAPLVKLRPPIEFLYVVYRTLRVEPSKPTPDQATTAMGQPFFGAPSPKGWPDENNAWTTADGIKTRLDWARTMAARYQQDIDVRHLLDGPLAGVASDETRTAVLQAESQQQALALLIMSPELQRR